MEGRTGRGGVHRARCVSGACGGLVLFPSSPPLFVYPFFFCLCAQAKDLFFWPFFFFAIVLYFRMYTHESNQITTSISIGHSTQRRNAFGNSNLSFSCFCFFTHDFFIMNGLFFLNLCFYFMRYAHLETQHRSDEI